MCHSANWPFLNTRHMRCPVSYGLMEIKVLKSAATYGIQRPSFAISVIKIEPTKKQLLPKREQRDSFNEK